LGIPIEQVSIVKGNTDKVQMGMGTYGSRSLAVGGTAIVNAIRRWIMAQQEPPSAMVKRKINQVKAATAAGASAWQDGMATTSPPPQ